MANKKDSLGDRMKKYEGVSRNYLTRRVPVIIRLDGKAFHTFTKGFKKPFDEVLTAAIQDTMKYLCENIQGCVFGYTQSDEITLVLTDYATLTTDSWFGYNIQKMASVSASMATLAFNRAFKEQMRHFFMRNSAINQKEHRVDFNSEEDKERCRRYSKAITKDALFDSRVFTLPKEEVCNCLIWRQQDAIRNSIEAAGQAFYSAKELHKKNQANILEMLLERGIDWEDYPHCMKYGSCCYKQIVGIPMEDRIIERRRWIVDKRPPIFSKEREYVEVWL